MKNIKNVKKMLLLIITGFMIASGVIFAGLKMSGTGISQNVENATFEILDESLLSEDSLATWMSENSKKEGVYSLVKDDHTYIMISYGETDKSNINICLEEITAGTKTKLKYSIINENNYSETVEKYTPKMILKINTPVKDVSWDKIEAE